jgi:hypothetical protein
MAKVIWKGWQTDADIPGPPSQCPLMTHRQIPAEAAPFSGLVSRLTSQPLNWAKLWLRQLLWLRPSQLS